MAWLESLLLLLAFCLVTAAGAVAADHARGPKKPVSESADDPAVRAATDAEMQRARQEEQRRATPEAKAERRRSRTAFKDASRDEAVAILKREGKELVEPISVRPKLKSDERIARYLGDYAAQVVDARGQTQFVESFSPMLARDENGKKAPIDLDLERDGGAYVPANTLASTRIAGDLSQGVALPDIGVQIKPVVPNTSEPAVVAGQKIAYPNVDRDTDFLVAPMSTGVETFSYLRSADSPEKQVLSFDLPEGAVLRPLRSPDMGDDGLEIVRGDKRLATVSPPTAWDADGRTVPVTAVVRDQRLEMRVEHRSDDFKYPVTLDPRVEVVNEFWFWYRGQQDWQEWYFQERDPWSNFGAFAGQWSWGNGLYLHMPKGAWFPGGDWAQWAYTAYPQTTITRVETWALDHQSAMVDWTPNSGSCMRTYLWYYSTGGVNVEDQCLLYNEYRPTSSRTTCWYWCGNHDGPEGNSFVFNFQAQERGTRNRDGLVKLGDASVYLLDRRAPWIEDVGPDLRRPEWSGSETRTGRVVARDEGLGVHNVELHRPGGSEVHGAGCAGSYNSRCRGSWPTDYAFNTWDLAEGVNRMRVDAQDPSANDSDPNAWNWDVRVDRSAPELEPSSGPLWNARGTTVGGDSYTLNVGATDRYSGVGGIDLKIDGTRVDGLGECAGDGCRQAGTVTWRPATDGIHTIEVTARDKTRSPRPNTTDDRPQRWQVIVDRNNPSASAEQVGLPGGWFDSASPTARVTASDAGAGVKRLSLEAPARSWREPASGQPPKEYACAGTVSSRCPTSVGPENMPYNKAGNLFPEGLVRIRATATDGSPQARTGSSADWTARVDHTAPQTTLTGTLADRAGGALTDASYNLHVAATDGSPTSDDTKRSGVKSIQVSVDGQTKPEWTKTATCDVTGCPMSESLDFTFDADQYTDGEHQVEVTTKDQLGDDAQDGARHTKVDRFEVLVDRRAPSSVTAEQIGLPAGWFDDATPTARITGTDAGSGIQRFELDSPDTDGDPAQSTWKHERAYDCGRDGQPRCPKTRSDDVLYNGPGNLLPEGMTPIRVSAFDAAGRGASAPTIAQAKVDHTPPSVRLSGPLREAGSRELTAGTYLQVDAADGKVDALDNQADTPRSGVESIEILVDGERAYVDRQDCARPEGSCEMSRTWLFNPLGRRPGTHTITVHVRDQLGHVKSESFEVVVDRTPPQTTITGDLRTERFLKAGEYSMRIDATDGVSTPVPVGAEGSGVKRMDVYVDGELRDAQPDQPCATGNCPRSRTFTLDTREGQTTEGRHSIRVETFDQVDNKSVEEWDVVVDRTKPAPVVLSGTLKDASDQGTTIYSGPHTLTVDAEDGKPVGEPGQHRSGVRSVRFFVDGVEQDEDDGTKPCPDHSCPMHRTWNFQADDWGPGEHTVRVETADFFAERTTAPGGQQAADATHRDVQELVVKVGSAIREASDKTGLEDFFHYDTTETGAGTKAHVNLATGNLVWHATPIVNPGRGLSMVVNLTYNSQGGGELPESKRPYRQAGRGFSLGISGLTRLNESLEDLGGVVAMTDPDGTRHDFTLTTDGVTYKPPPGVNLHLRRFKPDGETGPDGKPLPLAEVPEDIAKRHWAITQPNGVTHFFDLRGYQTYIADRNGNVMEFRYELVDTGAGLACPLTADAVCRVKSVVDPGGRALTVNYGSAIPPVPVDIAALTDLAERRRAMRRWAASVGRITSLTDHAGRRTTLAYETGLDCSTTQLPKDQLTELVEAAGTADERRWRFTYRTDGALGCEGQGGEMIAVDDPENRLVPGDTRTSFEYRRDDVSPFEDQSGVPPITRAVAVTDRGGRATRLEYDTNDDGKRHGSESADDRDGENEAYVTDARGAQTTYWLDDGLARLDDMRDAHGTHTTLGWDDDNNVTSLAEDARAQAPARPAVTRMTYNLNGMLRRQSDPNGHVTELTYREGYGTHTTALVDATNVAPNPGQSADTNGEPFVSDLNEQRSPRGNATTYDLDGRGNVKARIDGEGAVARTTYHADRNFLVKSETDEVGNTTEYPLADYDLACGQPRAKLDPRGQRWEYVYDATCNVTRVTDPRAERSGVPPDAFQTTLTYDSFDRLRSERRPKRSQEADLPLGERFVTRSLDYDKNGNQTEQTDGEGETAKRTYNATDKVTSVSSPPTAHYGEDGEEPEVTTLTYDAEDNLETRTQPQGARVEGEVDYKTAIRYDALNRKVAEVRSASEGSTRELATSYAYDARGNLVGVVDPRGNDPAENGACPDDPVEAAKRPGCRRYSYEYDLADNRTAQIEDPGGEALRTEIHYDENDNQTEVVDPRAFEPGGTPTEFTTEQRYDGRDLLTDRLDALDRRTHYERRADGKLAALTTPRGTASAEDGDFETRFGYDPAGDLTSRSLPRHPEQYGIGRGEISYSRNEVGDPIEITDPRGNSFTNTFYDTGELRTTGRPSWFKADGEGEISERSLEEMGNQAERPELPTSRGQGDFGDVNREEMPELMPKAGLTELEYDREMRLTGVRQPLTANDVSDDVETTLERDELGRVAALKRPYDVSPQGTADDIFITNRFAFDRNGNLRESVDGKGYATRLDYDQFDRLVLQAEPPSTGALDATVSADATKFTYDANGNQLTREMPVGPDATWRFSYDELDRRATQRNPEGNLTSYGYDAVGNQTLVRSPRGQRADLEDGDCAPQSVPERTFPQRDCFETERTFDAANQLEAVRDGLGHTTRFGYDLDGNQKMVEAPGAPQGPGTAPADRLTTRIYDGRSLPWRETTGSESQDTRRTRVTEFDGNGNLRRVVNPQGVGANGMPSSADTTTQVTSSSDAGDRSNASVRAATKNATVHEYSPDNVLTSVHLPWDDRDRHESDQEAREDQRRFRQDFLLDRSGRGWVAAIDAPYEWDKPAGDRCRQYAPSDENQNCTARTSYSHYDTGWIRTASDPVAKDPDDNDRTVGGQKIGYAYDKQGNQIEWRVLGRSDERRRVINRSFYPSGMLASRTGRKGTDDTPLEYRYAYDPNRRMTRMVDDRPGAEGDRITTFGYDLADRQTLVNEEPFGDGATERGKDTVIEYDADGNVARRQVDGRLPASKDPEGYSGGKRTSFEYDPLGRELWTRVQTLDGSSPAGPVRATETDYYASGDRSRRDKPHGSTERWFYYDDGRPSRMQRIRDDGATDKNQQYIYDRNANRTKDERGTHVFNARQQLTAWTRAEGRKNPGTTVRYRLNGAGAMLEKDDSAPAPDGGVTSFTYVGDELKKTTFKPKGGGPETGADYNNDPFGNVVLIDPTGTGTEEIPSSRFVYDEFERLTHGEEPRDSDPTTLSNEDYTYDALDRRDTRTKDGERHDFSYVGMSEQLSQETPAGEGKTRSYDYDSGFDRLGLAKTPSGDTPAYRDYAKDANGSVEGLESEDGSVQKKDRYDYDPYGQLESKGTKDPNDPTGEKELSAEEELDDAAKDNPFRFDGHYYDAGIKTYDMQARSYRPGVGRFLTQDRFESASGDLNLQSDPLTQNRYAFAGGNPVNNVEFDGHEPIGSFNPRGEQPIRSRSGRSERGTSAAGTRAARSCGCSTSSRPPATMPSTSSSYTSRPTTRGGWNAAYAGAQAQRPMAPYGANTPGLSDAAGSSGYRQHAGKQPSQKTITGEGCATALNNQCYAHYSDIAPPMTAWERFVGETIATLPFGGPIGQGGKLAVRGIVAGVGKLLSRGGDDAARVGPRIATEAPDEGTEVVQRAMSRAELEATRETGLVRGGRGGTHYASDAVNANANRARQRLALPQTPELRVDLRVPRGVFGPPSRVEPAFGMPGGGLERSATGRVRCQVVRVRSC